MKRIPEPEIAVVRFEPYHIFFALLDGRVLTVPLSWFPRLASATPAQQEDWHISPDRTRVHWPAVDEDVSIRVLMGLPS